MGNNLMGEDSVVLPIDIEVDVKESGDLKKLQAEIEKIKDSAEKSMKRKGKNALPGIDKQSLQDSITQLSRAESTLGSIMTRMSELSKKNLGSTFTEASKDVETYIETVKRLEAELKDARNKKGGAGTKVSSAKNYEKNALAEIEYIKNAAKNAGRELTEIENDRIAKLKLESNMRKSQAAEAYADASNHYAATKKDLEAQREGLAYAQSRKQAISEILDSEEDTLDYNKQIDEEVAKTNEQLYRTTELYKQIARSAKDLMEQNGVSVKNVDDSVLSPSSGDVKEKGITLERLSQAEKNLGDMTRKHAAAEEDEAGATKNSTAQFYYKLRAIKMLGFVVNQAYTAIENFGKKSIQFVKGAISAYVKLITPISTVRKLMEKLSSSTKKLSTGFKATTKAHDGFHISLKQALLTILKYGLGIRSLYILINKMRQAISKGFEQMAVQFADVNERMSSIVTSMNMIKAALTSVVEPLLTVVAPLLEKISAVVSDIAYKVASFIAALTGQTAVYKAVRVQTDYAASLDKTAKNAKEAKKQLSGLDKLNVINSDKDNDKSSDVTPTMGWEKVPIDETMADWAKKFKDFIDHLFAPIKAAWNRVKKYLEASWKYMTGQLGALMNAVAEDFWKVWDEKKTEDMFAYMLLSVGDIMNIIGTIAKKLKEAWQYNDNGYKILSSIRDIAYEVAKHFHDITSYTRDWAERELNFKPAMTALAEVLQTQIVPAIKRILDLIVVIWNYGILDLVRDFINTNLPVLIRGVGYFIEGFGLIAKRIQMALETGTKVGKNIEYTRSRLQQIIDKVEHFAHLISESFRQMGKDFKDWAAQLDFSPLFDSIIGLLENLTPMFEFIFGKFEVLDGKFQYTGGIINKLWKDVILPFWQYMIEDGGPKLLDILGQIFGEYDEETGMGIDWEHLTEVVGNFIDLIEPFLELAWETFLQIIKDIGKAFDDWVNSDSLNKIVESLKNWLNDVNPEDLAKKIEKFAVTVTKLAVELGILSKIIMPVVTGIMTLANVFFQTGLSKTVGEIATKIGVGSAGGASTGLAGALSGLAIPIGIVVGAIALMVGAFGGVGETIKELKERFDQIKESVTQFAEKIGIKDTLDNLKGAFDTLKGSLTELRPIFEFILDVLASQLGQAIRTAMGALDGLMLSITGVIDLFSGLMKAGKAVVDFFVSAFSGDTSGINKALTDFENGVSLSFLGIQETNQGLINGIAEAIGGFVDEDCPKLSNGISEFTKGVKKDFSDLRYDLIGDPIIYDIRDGIIEGFGEWISQTAKDVGGWVKDRITDFSNLAKDIGTNVKDTSDNVVKGFGSMKKGVTDKSKELIKTAKDKFADLKRNAKDKLASSQFKPFGENAVKGIESGIKAFGTVLSAANKGINDIKQRFRTGLNISTLRSVGVNLITGLKEGLMSALNSALQAITNICNQIVNKAKQAFDVHSPSRVFEDIGKNLMLGLEGGVEDNANDVSESFEDLVPSEKMFDTFYDKFIDTMSSVTEDTTNMFDIMFAHIEETMQKLENMKLMSTMYNNLNNLPKIDTPNVAKGYTLPSNKAFKQTASNIDLDKLPGIIKQAFIDAMNETADLQTGEETIILNLDGKKVFETIRNENTKFKKQHGVSAFG